MGLDMYIINDRKKEVFYWRKTPSVHEWFRQLSIKKEIIDEDSTFNQIQVPITLQDIKDFEKDLLNKNMDYEVTGFFFGSDSDMDDEEFEFYMKENTESIRLMKKALKKGRKIHYTSWW